jgi:aspartate/methionine/tyrosine aminotransferase
MELMQTPIIPVIAERVRDHPGTISLGQGVVYYGPPPQASERTARFFEDPDNHKYKHVAGIPPLLDALADKLRRENRISLSPDNALVVTAGGNMGFVNAVLALTDPGDEIVLPSPYYFNHEMAVVMASCRPVIVPTDGNYQLRIDALRSAITDRTRAIVTISPNNPTGAVYSKKSLKTVNDLCRERGLIHVSDEAYEYFTYDGAEHFSPASLPDSAEHTVSLFSLSKAYGFASWRIGYMVVPATLLGSVKKIQDTNLICPPVISQYAALGALEAGPEYCREKRRAIVRVRETALECLEPLRSFCEIPRTEGAFYFFLRLDLPMAAMPVAERLISEYGVAALPGETFGMEKGCYLRVAYGCLEESLAVEGLNRLARGLKGIAESG